MFPYYLRHCQRSTTTTRGRKKTKFWKKAPKKVPSFHLTGAETMKFIKEADIRAKEKEAKQKEKEEIKTKALKEAQKQKWKQKRK